MKDKIRALDIRLTDLSEYLKISRPTMYRYLNNYEEGETRQIPGNIQKLFSFIDKPKTTTKEQVMIYVMAHFCTSTIPQNKANVGMYVENASETDYKLELMNELIQSNEADAIITYLTECIRILQKESITQDDLKQISRFVIFKDSVSKNVSTTEEEIKFAEQIIGGKYSENQ